MYCECEEYPSAVEQAQFAAGWKDLLNRHDVLLLDTETSYKELFEIAVINTCHTSRKEPLIDNLVIPTRDIEPCWRWKHRITIDQMRKKKRAQPFSAIVKKLQRHIECASVICIYNKEHDVKVLRESAKRHGVEGEWLNQFADKSRCVMHGYAYMYGEWDYDKNEHRWHKLIEAAERKSVSTRGAHSALRDCEIMLRVMQKIAARGRTA